MAGVVERDTVDGWIDNPASISRATVLSWLKEHSIDFDTFAEDNGDNDTYRSDKVLYWLGY